MRRALKISLYTLLAIITLIVALLIYALSTDFSSWKETIESQMSKAMDRPVQIQSFRMDFGTESLIELQGLTIAEKANDPLRSVFLQDLVLGVNLGPLLFSDRLDITKFSMTDLDLKLVSPSAAPQDGTQNKTSKEGSNSSKGGSNQALSIIPLIRDMQLSNLNISIEDADLDAPILIKIDNASLKADGADQAQKFIMLGSADGHAIDIKGELGSVDSLFDADMPWNVDVGGALGPAELSLKGIVKDPIGGKNIDINFLASGQEIIDLTRLLGIVGVEKMGPWYVNAHLRGADKENIALEKLDFTLGREQANQAKNIYVNLKGRMRKLAEDGHMEMLLNIVLSDVEKLAALKQEWQNLIPDLQKFPALPEAVLLRGKLEGSLENGLKLDGLNFSYGEQARPLIKLVGGIDRLYPTSGIGLKLSIDIPNFSRLSPSLAAIDPNIALPTGILSLPPFIMQAGLEGALEDRIEVKALAIKLGKSEILGEASAVLKGINNRPEVDVKLTSPLLRLSDFSPIWEGEGSDSNTTGQAKSAEDDEKDDEKDEGKGKDPLQALNLFDMDFQYDIARIEAYGMDFSDTNIIAKLEDGKLELLPLSLNMGEGEMILVVKADANQNPTEFDVDVKTENLGLEKYGVVAAENADPAEENGLDSVTKLSFAGLDTQSILKSLEGASDFTLSGVDIGNVQIGEQKLSNLLDSDLLQGLDFTNIGCIGAPISFDDGVASISDGFLGVSDALSLLDGKVDYLNQNLDMNLEPDIGGMKVPLNVSGSFTDPKIALGGDGVMNIASSLLGGGDKAEDWKKTVNQMSGDLPSTHGCQSYISKRRDDPPSASPVQSQIDDVRDQVDSVLEDALGDDAAPVKSLLKGIFN